MRYNYTPGRYPNGSSRVIGTEEFTRELGPLVFEDYEVVINPWEHISPIPENERVGLFGFSHQFSRGSFFIFHREGREYRIVWAEITRS